MLNRNIRVSEKLSRKLYFTTEDLANLFEIKPESAKVLATRYTKKGIFIRLKKDFYVLSQNWQNYSLNDYLKLANLIQVPSYISFMTALNFYEITTQLQRDFIESAAQKRTVKFDIKGTLFSYYKLKKSLYFDFIKQDDVFIATKEKALIDSIYLYSFGKYKIDINSIDLTKLDKRKLKKLITLYPNKTKAICQKLCKI
jgi:predicted transcriptional regulator of viral defense system